MNRSGRDAGSREIQNATRGARPKQPLYLFLDIGERFNVEVCKNSLKKKKKKEIKTSFEVGLKKKKNQTA